MIRPITSLADKLLPDALWQRVQPLLPPPPSHARGGAPRTVPDRACMAAIVFMARTSTPWALLPVGSRTGAAVPRQRPAIRGSAAREHTVLRIGRLGRK